MRAIPAILAMAFLLSPARAHEAPSGWDYPMECCHNQDCGPLNEADRPKPLDGGDWLLTTGEIVPKSKVKFSPDGLYHLCRWHANNTVLCLFVPNMGS